MKRHFSQQSLLRTMMIVATLLFMMPAQNAWADNVATATVDGNTYTYSSLEAAVSAANGAQSTATVTLLKDITEQPCSLEVRKPMIIDLNNHRINTTTNYSLFYIELSMGQQMTIMNGSIRGRQYDVYINKGEAVLENITAEAPSSGSNCVGVCNNCTLTISKSITFDASIYNQGYVKIASGQKLYDKNGIEYSGYINSRVDDLANNTLSSLVTVTANGTTTPYNSLESAVSAATYAYINYGTAATVKLNHDITQQTCSLEVRKPMIIDLNGHVVNADNLTYAYGIFSIMNAEGQVIIKNGTISRRGENDINGFAIYNYNSNVELENVTVKNTYSTAKPCLYNNSTLTISKGITFVGSIDNSGTVQIASGQKLYDKNGIEYSGYINSRVANLANNTLSSLVTVTANGTTTPYNSLQDAVSAAANAYTTYGTAATITLNHDITEQPCSLEVRKPMIIDLNGHVVNADNLTYAYGIFSIMNVEGQVIIKNGTISRRGVNNYNGFAIYNYNSNVELENVTVKNTYSTDNPCLYNNGTLTISKNITLVGSIKNSGTVQIVDGQLLGDASGKYYLGTLTSAQVDALSNNTLSSLSVVASGSCGTDVKWALTGTSPNYTLTISGTGAIPSNPWYNYRADITSVVINNGVTDIYLGVFMNTPNLTSVTIPASVTSICQQAFDGCTNLETVSGCEGVTEVGDKAFRGTKWLTDQPDGVVYIGKVAYLGKNVSGEVNIKAGTVSISNNAFKDCTNLTSVTIPNSVTYIGYSAFEGCTSLTSITIPNGVTEILDNAFYQTGLTSITIPASVTYIGANAFFGCTSLISIEIPNSVTYIGYSAFKGCTGLTSITIPNSVTDIGYSAFSYCTSLTSVTIPNSVTDIGYSTFQGCTGLTSIEIPNSVTDIGSSAFEGCTGLTSITIPNNVTSIQSEAFRECSNLATVTIGSGVESIGGSAFYSCSKLETVTVYAQDCSLESYAFNRCHKDLQIYVFSGLVDDYQSLPGWSNYRSIIKGMTGGYCGATDHKTDVVWVLTGDNPYTLTISGTGAMEDYGTPDALPWKDYRSSITSVVIENGVTSIGDYAFEGCNNDNLTSVTIPASVTSIGDFAFGYCTCLASVTIPVASLTYYGVSAFDNTAAGLKIYVPGSALSTYEAATNWSKYEDNFVGVYTVAFGSLPDGVTGVAPSMAAEGETVTLSFSGVPAGKVPGLNITYKFYDNDYDVYELKDNGDGTFSFVMPNGNVTVTASELKNDIKSCTATVPDQSLGTNSYINYKFWDTPATIGETVTDDETILTLGTDYQFGSITYADMTNHSEFDMPDNVGDECLVEIKGLGDYAGSKWVPFMITTPDDNGEWDDLAWSFHAGTLTINKKDGVEGNVAMKEENEPKNTDYTWFRVAKYVKTVTLGEGITSIAAYAFAGTDNVHSYGNLATLNLPSTLTVIGDYAFAFCSNLTIDLDAFLAKKIPFGDNAFYQISCLTGSLADNGNNTDKIKMLSKATANVTLSGRTLYKDGNWNTICLPFSLGNFSADEGHHFDGTPLEGATVMELKVADSEFDAASGTLSLFFTDAKSISAGTPYIVKWEGDGTNNLVNPEFTGVKVFTDAPTPVQSYDEKVQFRGIYSPTNIYSADHDNLFLGIGKNNQNEDVSMLYWPNTTDYTLGAFRAYFHVDLTETNGVRDIVLNFEDGTQTTGIIGHTDITDNTDKADAAWYTINGVRLSAKPTAKGLYIHGNRKVVIK